MDTRQLRYFVAVYEQRNLSRAANLSHVAPSALSHHVANLEAALGTQLFRRLPRGMEPTAAGERLYQHAKAILRTLGLAERDIKEASAEVSGDFAVAMAYSAVKAIGLRLMEAVLQRHPRVRLTISESLSGASLVHLAAAEVDLALVFNPPADARLATEPVLEERMVCVGRRSIIGDSEESLTVEQFLALPILLLGHAGRAMLDNPGLLRRMEAAAKLSIQSVYAMREALLAGLGCTLATRLYVRELVESGELHARPIVQPEISRTLHLCHLADDRPATFLMEAMRRLILSLIAEEVASGAWDARALG
jgi:LysR family nitrogen assimilation transcriptional regulator